MRGFSWYKFILGLAVSTLVWGALAVLLPGFARQAPGPESPWRDLDGQAFRSDTARQITVQEGRYLGLDLPLMRALLESAPPEGPSLQDRSALVLSLPMPDGTSQRFQVVESPVMEPGLAAKFPEVKTYAGQGLDDPTATARLDVTLFGFHGQVLNSQGAVYIDPLYQGRSDVYVAYDQARLVVDPSRMAPELPPIEVQPGLSRPGQVEQPAASMGAQLRTYRLALAATAEYTAYFGGTVAAAHSEMVTAVNRVTGIYEKEVAVRLVLVANNDLLIYTDPATDPYTNNSSSSLLSQNQTNLDAVIGSANYDIGHVFSTYGGGLADLAVVCNSFYKAEGETGTTAPTGDAFWVDYVAHEMGHQFGGNHTFNGQAGSCSGGNRAASAAYEPGSGSTIMAYAGICSTDNLQPHSDPYFHSKSFEEIAAYITMSTGNSCPQLTNTGNTPPVIKSATNAVTIPVNTPFILTGSASDANGDALTYQWEQYDLGTGSGGPPPSVSGYVVPPHFRSFNPTTDPFRVFPKLSDIVNNAHTIGELLPSAATTLHFRFTVRDNRANGGGVTNTSTSVVVSGAAGPFVVTSPNAALTWQGGTSQTITWNVANTTASPVSCAKVKIDLSTDGGYTYPTSLISSTSNDGSQAVTLPNIDTSTARVRVMCASSIFFDISDANFSIQKSAGLSISQIATPSQVPIGGQLTYALTVDNSSTLSASGVVITDTLPVQATYISTTGSCNIVGSSPTVLRCSLGTLPGSAKTAVNVVVKAPASGAVLTNQVSLSNSNDVPLLDSLSNLSTSVYVSRNLLPLVRK